MNQSSQIRCYYCQRPVDPRFVEECPYCHYPVSLDKERLFLETSLQQLRRCSAFGEARLTVGDVIRRYAARLETLRRYRATPMPSEMIIALPRPSAVEGHAEKLAAPLPGVPFMPSPPAALRPQRPVFSLRSFLADQTINIVAALGAFLVLLGALSFIATTTNLLLSFIIVFVIHALFGGVGISTYRFRSFRVVSLIYTMIFALLVPLVGFSAYRLIEGHLIEMPLSTLIAAAAAYAAIVYSLLAVYQRFKPFAYLGVTALAVADLALAQTLGLAYWWWPVMLMLLTFPMLLSMPSGRRDAIHCVLVSVHDRRGGRDESRPYVGRLAVLQEPVRLMMFVFVGASVVGVLFSTLAALSGLANLPGAEVRFSLFAMSLLALAWTSLYLWVAQRRRDVIAVAFLFLACVLSFCYAFDFQATGYALALTLVALLYHGLSRLAGRPLQAIGMRGSHLDTIALWLVAAVPVIASPLLLNQLFAAAFPAGSLLSYFFYASPYHTGWEPIAELVTVILGALLTIDVALTGSRDQARTGTTARNNWPWLLLLAGFLLNVAYTLVVLLLNIVPVWSFLALTIALVALAVVTRRPFGAAWANPLDIVALAEAGLTLVLSLGQSLDSIWMLLLFFAAGSYGVVLYQRRHRLLFLPLVFALLATPILFYPQRTSVLLIAGVTLPFMSAAIHRLITEKAESQVNMSLRLQLPVGWEWPVLCFGLLCGALVAIRDVSLSSSILQDWLGVHLPVAIEIAALSIAWYAASALANKQQWLIAVIAFAVVALVLPANPFWVLVGVTGIAALLAIGVSRAAERTWALPLYSAALLGGIMSGYAGYAQGQWQAASWVLLAAAALAYAIGVVEEQPLPLWIAVAFATWSLIDAAVLAGDLYRPPITALLCAGIGVTLRRLNTVDLPFQAATHRSRLLEYAVTFYATALAAAILTGVYSTLSGVNRPFYGAVPAALLVFALVAFVVMLVERFPLALFIPVGLAAWATALLPVGLIPHLLAFDALCVLVFVSQFVWKVVPSMMSWQPSTRLHHVFSLGGQTIIVLYILVQGVLPNSAGSLAHVGAASLLLLAALLFWYGRLQPGTALRHYSTYGAGLLLSLVITWELLAQGYTRLELLTLAPASYLIVAAPFLLRDEILPRHHSAGQIAAIIGAALLLLPELWLSFGQQNLLPTLLLAGESLLLLVLGITTRLRIFVLSGAGLVVVSGLRALFLPTLGLPPSLALTVLGVTLLAIATGLSLARHRLQVAWTRWE